MNIDFQSRVTIRPNVLFREIENESVLLNIETEYYFGLDEVGTQMWNTLVSSMSLQEAYDTLLELYDIDANQLKQDLLELITQLVNNQLIEIQDV